MSHYSDQSPYQPPVQNFYDQSNAAVDSIRPPAIALIAIATISILMSLLFIGFDFFLVTSGINAQLDRGQGISRDVVILVRIAWTTLILFASCVVLYGAIKMLNLEHFTAARVAAIVAIIPAVGPCCLLAIPFGIWALVVLNQPGVRAAFRS